MTNTDRATDLVAELLPSIATIDQGLHDNLVGEIASELDAAETRGTMSAYVQKIVAYRNELAAKQTSIDMLNSQCDSLKKQLAAVQADADSWHVRYSEAEGKVASATTEIDSLQTQIDTLKANPVSIDPVLPAKG